MSRKSTKYPNAIADFCSLAADYCSMSADHYFRNQDFTERHLARNSSWFEPDVVSLAFHAFFFVRNEHFILTPQSTHDHLALRGYHWAEASSLLHNQELAVCDGFILIKSPTFGYVTQYYESLASHENNSPRH